MAKGLRHRTQCEKERSDSPSPSAVRLCLWMYMPPFSFIHTADLHLGSPFSTLGASNPELASEMRSATFEAFERIVQLCLKKEADFLLVAGDVFDGADRSIRAQITFAEGLKKLGQAGIRSFVVHGNHDPMGCWSRTLEWPQGVHVFGDSAETVRVERNGALLGHVQGISYARSDERRNLARFFSRTNAGFHVGLLHANVGADTGHEPYAPCALEDLIRAGMDYWALGHVHSKRFIFEENPCALYPGNTQGRNIRERGERGCYLVRVGEDHHLEPEFLATDTIRWTLEEVPIDGIAHEQALIRVLEDRCLRISEEQSGRSAIARITLTGHGPLYSLLSDPNTLQELLELVQEKGMSLSPFVWVEHIRSEVRPEWEKGAWIRQADFLGELLRCAREIQDDGAFETFLQEELGPLVHDSRARGFMDFPGGAKARDLLMRAEDMCVAALRDEDGG